LTKEDPPISPDVPKLISLGQLKFYRNLLLFLQTDCEVLLKGSSVLRPFNWE